MTKKKSTLIENPDTLYHKPPSLAIRELGYVDVKVCKCCKTISQIPEIHYKKKDQRCTFCGENKLEFHLAQWVSTTKWWYLFFETGYWDFYKEELSDC